MTDQLQLDLTTAPDADDTRDDATVEPVRVPRGQLRELPGETFEDIFR